jgi:hypothetical protein
MGPITSSKLGPEPVPTAKTEILKDGSAPIMTAQMAAPVK